MQVKAGVLQEQSVATGQSGLQLMAPAVCSYVVCTKENCTIQSESRSSHRLRPWPGDWRSPHLGVPPLGCIVEGFTK